MAAARNEVLNEELENRQTEEAREFVELLKGLSGREKEQVKGIMIGMKLTREQLAAVQTA